MCAYQTVKDGESVFCRAGMPMELFTPTEERPAVVNKYAFQPGLRTLNLARNDNFVESYENHILLANLGNIS